MKSCQQKSDSFFYAFSCHTNHLDNRISYLNNRKTN